MTSYYDQLDSEFDISGKSSAGPSRTTDEGQREPTLDAGTWVSASDGTHYPSSTAADNPISEDFRIDIAAYMHRLFALVSYLNYLVYHEAADPDYLFNDNYNDNFAYWATFTITGASGSTITIDTTGIDYRSVPVDRRGGFADPDNGDFSLEFVTADKPFPFVNDMVVFSGNSCLKNKITARILGFTLGSNQMTLTLDQPASYAATKLDSGGAAPTCLIVRNAVKQPELVPKIETRDGFFGRYVTIEIARADGQFDFDVKYEGAEIGIAYPYRDGDYGFAGTFKLEVSEDSGTTWSDITASLRYQVEGKVEYQWTPYVVCTHKTGGGLQTDLDLTGKISEDVTNLRVTVVMQDADKTVDGAHSPCPKRCQHCQWDLTGHANKYAAQGTNGVGTSSDGRHWYCAMRDNPTDATPKANLDKFRGGECYQWDCPNFEPARPGQIGSLAFARLISGLGELQYQLAPGNSNTTNFLHLMIDFPGILFQMTPNAAFGTNAGAYRSSFSYHCGKYIDVDGVDTDADGNESFNVISGADFDHNGDVTGMNWRTNRWPSEARGIVQRRLGTTWRPGSQSEPISSQTEAEMDPNYIERALPVPRNLVPVFRFAAGYGGDLSFTARNLAGLEGEHRVQRPNRATVQALSGINTTLNMSPSDSDVSHFRRYEATIGGKAVKAYIQFRRPGLQNFGYKRVGGTGFNANVWRCEDLGGGLFKLHCAPGLFMSHTQVTQGDIPRSFWAGSNVVEPPYPYRVTASVYNSANNRLWGGVRNKACRGDVVEFSGIEGAIFPIEVAEAFSGDTLIGKTYDRWSNARTIGSILNFNSLRPGGDEVIEITRLQINPGSGWVDWFDISTPAVNEKPYIYRPLVNSMTANDLASAYMDHDVLDEQGSMNAFMSFEMLRYLILSSAGLLRSRSGLPQIRAYVNVDGVPEANPVEIAVSIPFLQLSYGLDTSRLELLRVYAYDPRMGDDYVELSFAGYASPTDISVHTNHLQFFYWGTVNRLTFHPNMAGAYIVAFYGITSTVDLGDTPIGVATNRDTGTISGVPHYKFMDTLIVRDVMGIMADAGAAFWAGRDFLIGTSQIIAHPGNADYSGGEYSQFRDEVHGTMAYQTLSEGTDIHTHWTQGRVYLTETGLARLPEQMGWRTFAQFMNAAAELPAELLRALARLADCLDTVQVSSAFGQVDTVDSQGYAELGFDSYALSTSASPYYYLDGDLLLGLTQTELAAIEGGNGKEKIIGADSDGGIPSNVHSEEIEFDHASAGSSEAIYIGIGGLSGDGAISAFFKVPIFQFNYNNFLRKIPPGSEILESKIRVFLSADFRSVKWKDYKTIGNGATHGQIEENIQYVQDWNEDDIYYGYTPPASPYVNTGDTHYDWTKTADLDIAFAVAGRRYDGRWVSLGTFDPGTLDPGKYQVIEFIDTIQQLLDKKDSIYEIIGIFPTSASGGEESISIEENGDNSKDLIKMLMDGASWSVEHTETVVQATATHTRHYVLAEGSYLFGTQMLFGDLYVKFKLPSGVVSSLTIIPGGSLPDMAPVTV